MDIHQNLNQFAQLFKFATNATTLLIFVQWLEHSCRAHACGAKLLKLWVPYPRVLDFFSYLSILSSLSLSRALKEVQHY